MTKQEKIDEVYCIQSDMIDSDGWATYGCDEAHEFGIEPFGEYETRNHINGVYEWRPKSLQGIENNNGWIKIESEADLPRDYDNIHFIVEGFEENKYVGYYNDKFFYNLNGAPYGKSIVSHYQPITYPKPLIY